MGVPREPAPRSPWPDRLEWKPNRIWACDFTHWTRARRASIAILDVVSRKWLATLTSAEETSTQVEVCFTAALEAEGLLDLADERATEALREAIASGERDQVQDLAGEGQLPLLLAISDNGPQMRSVSTREFLAGVAIAQQFGRPHTPQDQAWIETLFGHVKGEWPHLEKTRDPGELGTELDRVRSEYNTIRLHASIGNLRGRLSVTAPPAQGADCAICAIVAAPCHPVLLLLGKRWLRGGRYEGSVRPLVVRSRRAAPG